MKMAKVRIVMREMILGRVLVEKHGKPNGNVRHGKQALVVERREKKGLRRVRQRDARTDVYH